jgi:hypothetical protein
VNLNEIGGCNLYHYGYNVTGKNLVPTPNPST